MLKRVILLLALVFWLSGPPSHARAQHEPAPEQAAQVPEHVAENTNAALEGGEHHAKPPLIPDPTSREVQLQALWVVIIFAVLLAVLYPTAWKNVLAGLKSREQRIRKDISDAEAARARAEATLRDYTAKLQQAEAQIREMMGKAQADAEQTAAGIRARGQQEAEESKERAVRDIDAARDAAISQVYEQAANLATTVAGKILKRELRDEDQKDLVLQSLDQVRKIRI
jgi:F-type H+-transporting ATPase subunit b